VFGGPVSAQPGAAAEPEARSEGDKAGSIFRLFSLGVVTARDDTVYDYSEDKLRERMAATTETYNGEVDRYRRNKAKPNVDAFVNYAGIKWSRDLKKDLERGVSAEYSESKILP